MDFASATSSLASGSAAVDAVFGAITEQLDPASLDLVLLFCTAHYEDEIEAVLGAFSKRAPNATMLGCTSEGTIGGDRESQSGCSMSVLAGALPGVKILPFDLDQEQMEATEGRDQWMDLLGAQPETEPLIIALGDPFSFDIQTFLETANEALPGVPIVGGMASAAEAPGQNRLFCDGQIHRQGLAGVTLSGNIAVRTVVSQGCRPIGTPFVVTKGEHNLIHELGGKPALEQLSGVIQHLSEKDVGLARKALFVGRVIDEYQESFARGDFLIQNIVGFDPARGTIAVAALVRVGTTVQFHVRDAEGADEDLRTLLGGCVAILCRGPAGGSHAVQLQRAGHSHVAPAGA